MLAACSLLASKLSRTSTWTLAVLAFVYGGLLVWRQLGLPPRQLLIPPDARAATCDGERMHALHIAWRGPLAFLHWRDARGRVQRLQLWPDVLDVRLRRELRLAMQQREAARNRPSMAG